MTLEEMKIKVYSLIEEYSEDSEDLTDDEDLAAKMNSVINQIQNELCRMKRLPAYKKMQVTKGQEITLKNIAKDMYQLNLIRDIDADIIDNLVIFNEDGEAKIHYYKYPVQINNDTDDSYVFELPQDLLEIMPYGVAGDLLKSDVSAGYGAVYSNRYREMMMSLDPRYNSNSVFIDGGVNL